MWNLGEISLKAIPVSAWNSREIALKAVNTGLRAWNCVKFIGQFIWARTFRFCWIKSLSASVTCGLTSHGAKVCSESYLNKVRIQSCDFISSLIFEKFRDPSSWWWLIRPLRTILTLMLSFLMLCNASKNPKGYLVEWNATLRSCRNVALYIMVNIYVNICVNIIYLE